MVSLWILSLVSFLRFFCSSCFSPSYSLSTRFSLLLPLLSPSVKTPSWGPPQPSCACLHDHECEWLCVHPNQLVSIFFFSFCFIILLWLSMHFQATFLTPPWAHLFPPLSPWHPHFGKLNANGGHFFAQKTTHGILSETSRHLKLAQTRLFLLMDAYVGRENAHFKSAYPKNCRLIRKIHPTFPL